MDEHLESRLREELHRTVDHLQVSPDLWQRIRRRHRREPRQRLLAAATSMALLAVVVAAALPVVREAADRSVAGPTPSVSPTPSVTPAPPTEGGPPTEEPTGPVFVLASGEVAGKRWEFVAHLWAEGLCYGFLDGGPDMAGGGATCDQSNPLEGTADDPAASGTLTGSGQDQPSFVFGPVSKDAARVRIQLPGGQVHEVRPVGQNAGFAVNFYVLALPPNTPVDGARATALDASGRVLHPEGEAATTTTTPPTTTTTTSAAVPSVGEPVPPGDELSPEFMAASSSGVMLASGMLNDRMWMLVFFDRDQLMCIAWLHYFGGGCYGETASAAPLDGSPVAIAGYGGGGEDSHMYGVVSKEVARVRLELPDAQGQVIDLRPVGHELAGPEVNFFAVMLPGGTSWKAARVTAYDAAGRRLGTDTAGS